MGQSPALTSDPHHICPSTDGIDDLIWWYRCNGLNASILENIQPTLSGSQPGAALRVDIYRAIVFETTIANRCKSYERTVPNAAQPSRTSDPEIPFAVLEQNVNPAVSAELIF